MITVREVKTKEDRKKFVNLPLKMYKSNPYFVPPLYADEMAVFTEKNVYAESCDSVFFLAEEDGKVVGRIQGIIQKQYNEIHKENRIRFTRFDSENRQEIAAALFKALEDWGRANGMDTVCGPLGYSDLEREGLLIEGFDELSTFEEQYNFDYYASLIEGEGYAKEIDWLESKLYYPDEVNPMIAKVAERTLQLNKLHIASSDMSKKAYINKYKDGVFECIDRCYADLYGTVPFTDGMKKQIIDQFLLVINKKYLIIICDENEKVVSFGLCFPGFGKSLQKSGGRLTPAGLIRMIKAVNNPEILDLGLVAVLPEYQARGVNAVILNCLLNMLKDSSVKYCETNLNLETNTQVLAQWKYFKQVQHKRRRSYIKKLV